LGIKITRNTKETVRLNYEGTIENIKGKLEIWKIRKMSLMGKIMILKTMALSTIIYLLTNLPSPENTYIKELENIIYNFIWPSNNERIARKTLIGPIDLGGIKMPDISTLNETLKIGWIIRMYKNEGNWSNCLLSYIPSPNNIELRDYFLRSNLNAKHLSLFLKTKCSILWKEPLYLWFDYNYKQMVQIIDTQEILKQSLFFNSNILIQQKPVYYLKWYKAGLRTIGDLLTDENEYKNIFVLEKEYRINIDFLTYMGIYSAIPKQWKEILKRYKPNKDSIKYKHHLDELISKDKCTKIIYCCRILRIVKTPIQRLLKWEEELETGIDTDEWLDSFKIIYKCTQAIKIRNFDYRFRIRDILTNSKLYKMGLSDTEECYMCGERETILHLYWDCKYNKRLWERLKNIISNAKLATPGKIECLLSLYDTENNTNNIKHFLCTLTKKYIHDSKCNKRKTSVYGLLNYFKTIKDLEEKTSSREGIKKYRKIKRLWHNIKIV